MAREYPIVLKLRSAVKAVGGACENFRNPGVRGDPDQLLSFPWGYHCLVECKWGFGVRPRPHQMRRHKYWRDHGMDVWVANDDGSIRAVVAIALRSKAVSDDRGEVADRSSARNATVQPRHRKNRDGADGA